MEETLQISFSVLQETIQKARYNALKVINAGLVNLYWQVGAYVSTQLTQSKWGEKTVQQLTDFLQNNEPGLKGFDRKNIYRMVQFYESYYSSSLVRKVNKKTQDVENQYNRIVAPAGRQFEKEVPGEFVTSVRRQIFNEEINHTILVSVSWTHNRTIFSRCKTEEEREFYLRLCIKENFSVKELERQIDSGTFERIILGNRHLSSKLKAAYPEIINCIKDSYVFEFLNLPGTHSESDIQKGLIGQMKRFILELGKDFLFIGEEYKVLVGNRDFYIDLLFYHRGLQCLVAFELKKEKFEPEHLGKLSFYLEALDKDVKNENEKPSIGILLCKDKDSEVVEYALNRSLSPAMVAEYSTLLPDKKMLQQKLHELFENTGAVE
jgi:predicted nuclease of restriction endonuclease-like (RecB) superfamily